MIKTIELIVFMVVLLSLGVGCLFFSSDVQRLAVKLVDYGLSSHIDPLRKFVRSNAYLLSVKLVGVIAMLCFAFLL